MKDSTNTAPVTTKHTTGQDTTEHREETVPQEHVQSLQWTSIGNVVVERIRECDSYTRAWHHAHSDLALPERTLSSPFESTSIEGSADIPHTSSRMWAIRICTTLVVSSSGWASLIAGM